MITRSIFLILVLCMAGLLLDADAVAYTYDDAGRLTAVNYSNGASITYTLYDAAGNLIARTVTAASSSANKPEPKGKPAATEKFEKPKAEQLSAIRLQLSALLPTDRK